MSDGTGAARRYRGYMAAWPGVGRSVPQSVQQLVMREYCAARGMTYLLAATEYCMRGSTMMLDGVAHELEHLDGIVAYSMFSLPERRQDRARLYTRVLALGRTLHLAAERFVVSTRADVDRLEDIWLVKDIIGAQDDDALGRVKEWDQRHA